MRAEARQGRVGSLPMPGGMLHGRAVSVGAGSQLVPALDDSGGRHHGLVQEARRVMSVSGCVTVASAPLGAFKQALNQSGWVDGEVIAAGQLRQGKALSMVGMLTGTALIELARPRRSKSLPRHFVLAATADRVVAFKASSLVMGEDTGPEMVRIKQGECASWPRASVRLVDLSDGAQSKGGTLELEGTQRLPVARPNLDGDPNTDELLELLGGLSPQPQRNGDYQARPAGRERRSRGRPAPSSRPSAPRAPGRRSRGLGAEARPEVPRRRAPGRPPQRHLPVERGRPVQRRARPLAGGTDGVLFTGEALRHRHGGALPRRQVIGPRESVAGSCSTRRPGAAGRRRAALLQGAVHVRRRPRPTWRRSRACTWHASPSAASAPTRRWAPGGARLTTSAARALGGPHPRALRRAHGRALLAGPIRELLSVRAGARLRDPHRVRPGDRVAAGLPEARRGSRRARGDDGGARRRRPQHLRAQRRLAPLATRVQPPSGWRRCAATRARSTRSGRPAPGSRGRRDRRRARTWPSRTRDAFHIAFPALNFPGEAFGVLHGPLPGTALTGDCFAVRSGRGPPRRLPELLKDPGGQSAPTSPSWPWTRAPADAARRRDARRSRVAVADGVLTAWRVRRSWQADGEALDRLAADVAALVRRRRLVD